MAVLAVASYAIVMATRGQPNRHAAHTTARPPVARRPRRHRAAVPLLRLPASFPARTVWLPILMYHRIGPLTGSLPPITRALTVAPSEFRAQMHWLVSHGFHGVTQLQAFNALEKGRPLPPRPVMITFDDGYRDVLWNAAPTLRRLHLPATAYVITGRISGPDPSFLTWPELRRLEADGVTGGSHTVHHLEIPLLTSSEAIAELERSRETLQHQLGHPVQWFAYPAGAEDASAARLVQQAGYVLAVTTRPGSIQNAASPLALHRYEILDTTSIAQLAALVSNS